MAQERSYSLAVLHQAVEPMPLVPSLRRREERKQALDVVVPQQVRVVPQWRAELVRRQGRGISVVRP